MFTSRREKWSDKHIIAMVELDMHKRQVRIVWAREAITECLRELEDSKDHHGDGGRLEGTAIPREGSQ
jgi:hypothetical protein